MEYHKRYYQKNKEKKKESHQRWYEKNKERIKKQMNEWRVKNKEKVNENAKKYRERNPEKIKARHMAGYYLKHLKKLGCEFHHQDYSKPLQVKVMPIKEHQKLRNKEKE